MANFLSNSDSDSDLEMLEQLSDWDEEDLTPRRRYKRINYFMILNDSEFTFRFRLNKAAVEALLSEIMPFVKVTQRRNHGIAPLHQLLLTLRFYALGTMLMSVADFAGVSKSSASRIVQNISESIAKLYNRYITMHRNSVDKFHQIAKFPRVLGAIDCTHMRIQPTYGHSMGEEFRNQKGYFSLNVQTVCDADLKIMNLEARPGSTHDATVFDKSDLRSECDARTYGNLWLLGDSAYPNRPYLLTPVINPTDAKEQKYNDAHASTRNVIERMLGVWKRRFPVVALTLRLSLHNIQTIIIATAVLHNICRNNNLEELSPEVEIANQITDSVNVPQPQDLQLIDIWERTTLINEHFGLL